MQQRVRPGMPEATVRTALEGIISSWTGNSQRRKAKYFGSDGELVLAFASGRVTEIRAIPREKPNRAVVPSRPPHPPGKVKRVASAIRNNARPASLIRQVYFVPLGRFPDTILTRMTGYCGQKLRLNIQTLPGVELDASVVDMQRNQFIAEQLLARMKRQYAYLAAKPQSILIGLTAGDMFTQAERWNYCFGIREDRFAVISYARMDPANYGEEPDPRLLERRLRKMILKYIGMLYYHLPTSSNPQSALYSPILGLDDLDRMGEEYL
jgi:predicted Zn-dependent protease